MTFEEQVKAMLFSCGMLEDQCGAVFEAVRADKVNEAMLGRWQDQVGDYPLAVMLDLLFTAKGAALKYIDVNCPQAWFRPLFAKGDNAAETTQGEI